MNITELRKELTTPVQMAMLAGAVAGELGDILNDMRLAKALDATVLPTVINIITLHSQGKGHKVTPP